MTATQIRSDAAALVEADPRFAGLEPDSLPIEVWGPGFGSLVHLILGQQVSIEAADAMYANLEGTLGTVTATGLLRLDEDTMRSCGFTRMKAEYARGLAHEVVDGFSFDALTTMADDAVVDTLTRLRGIGRWTAECYLVFCLGRPDVFPPGDLALRIGLQELLGMPQQPSEPITAEVAAGWSPRRTAAAYLVWQFYLERRGRAASVPYG